METFSVRYVHKISPSEKDVGPAVSLSPGAFSNSKTLGKALREAGVLLPGGRVRNFQVEGDKVVVFPVVPRLTTYWHSIVLTSETTVVAPTPIDLEFHNYGSVVMLHAKTHAAKKWVDENIQYEGWQVMGEGIACEPRMAVAVAQGAQDEGFEVVFR
jgi:hypothetical protein